jgi:hypothetical protein
MRRFQDMDILHPCLADTNGLGLRDRTRSLKWKRRIAACMHSCCPFAGFIVYFAESSPHIGGLAVLDDMMMVVSLLFSWQTNRQYAT